MSTKGVPHDHTRCLSNDVVNDWSGFVVGHRSLPLARGGASRPPHTRTPAQVLLKLGNGWRQMAVAQAVGVCRNTV